MKVNWNIVRLVWWVFIGVLSWGNHEVYQRHGGFGRLVGLWIFVMCVAGASVALQDILRREQ